MNDQDAQPPVHKNYDRRKFLTVAGLTVMGSAVAGASFAGASFAGAAAREVTAMSGACPPPPTGGFSVPLDSGVHTRTWMAWPDSSAIWGRALAGVQANIATIAQTIGKYEPVMMCANPASAAKAQSMCGGSVTVISSIPVDDCWMRDSGPVFRTDGAGGLDAISLNFNGWGGKQTHSKDQYVADGVAGYVGVPITHANLVSEGGAIETDGAGTLMATRSSIINENRNPGMSQADIESAMLDAYAASKVIWFNGVVGQDITDDHVDATSRFLAPGKGLVEMPVASANDAYTKDARQEYQILSTATTATGGPIAVTQLQGADYNKIRSTNQNFLAAYANYYVCNGAVIMGQFGDSGADAAAKSTMAGLFPGRVIEQLNIDNLGTGGGGIHCVTQQQPAV